MKLFYIIFASIFALFGTDKTPVANPDPAPEKPPYVLTLIGYIKIGNGGFGASDGCGATNLTTPVYSNVTSAAQLTIGDILMNSSGVPINGGGQGYGFTGTLGGNATRGIKLGGTNPGEIEGIALCSGAVEQWYYNSTGANCALTSFPSNQAIFGAAEDPQLYLNKIMFTSALGSVLGSATATVSNSVDGTAIYTLTTDWTGRITSLTPCVTTPIVNAGSDQLVSLPSPTIDLIGSAFDPDFENPLSYLWTQTSGPNAATIVSNTSLSTGITGVIAGTYVFKLQVTDASSEVDDDEVTVVVVSAPICPTPVLKKPDADGIWDFSGATGFGSQTYNDTFAAHKYRTLFGAFVIADGDMDPAFGDLDFDHSVGGTQSDNSSIVLARSSIHNGNTLGAQTYPSYFHLGNGNQRVIVIDYKRIIDWDKFYINHSIQVHNDAFEMILTSDPLELGKAIFEWDPEYTALHPTATVTVDYLVDLTAAAFDSVINIRESARYLILRFNNNDGFTPKQGADVKGIYGYGCESATTYSATEVFADWTTPVVRDTTQPGKYINGKVIATPTGGTDMAATFPSSVLWGGYINAVGSGPNQGTGDTADADVGPGHARLKLHLPMYGDNNIWNPANKIANELESYMAVTNPNRYLLKQIEAAGSSVLQHVPINKLGIDMRLKSSYSRYVWYYMMLVGVLGPTAPNPSAPYYTSYMNLSQVVGYWPGGSGWGNNIKQYFPPDNEKNLDFRPGGTAQSSWMPPVAFWKFHDTLYTVWKQLYPTRPFVMQGVAASGFEYIMISEQLGKIFYQDRDYKMCDKFNMHTVMVKNMPDLDGGCAGNIGQQSVLPGYRLEGQRIQLFLDIMAKMSGGVFRGIFITEHSIGSSRGWQLPITGCDFNVQSVPFVGNRPTYRPHHLQGYGKLQTTIIFGSIQGVERVWGYEAFDLTDSTGLYYDGNDGSQGDINLINNWIKSGHYISQQFGSTAFLWNYRVVSTMVVDSIKGQFKALFRHVDANKRDSFCWVTFWQDWADPVGNRLHTFPNDVTTIRHMRHNPAGYTPTTVGSTLTAHQLSIPSVFEPDYMFFKSPEMEDFLDDPEDPDPPMDPPERAKLKNFKFKGTP